MKQRLQKLRAMLRQKQVDAMLITSPVNRRYLTGFTGSSGYALVTQEEASLVTDARYITQSKQEAPNWNQILHQDSILDAVVEACKQSGITSLAFEAKVMTVQEFQELRELMPDDTIFHSIVNGDGIERLRQQKDENEINKIEQACQVVDQTFDQIIQEMKPGMTEREVATRIEFYLREFGATSSSFEIIVASGLRSALPHGLASDKRLENGELVLLDFGAWVDGYTSDISRTVVLGESTEKQEELYQIVRDAQEKAIEAIRPGKTGKEIDAVARDWIASQGYDDYFGHATGHGIGLEVHEGPTLRRTSDDVMEPGMVVTVEPGIYVPEVGGVRIEDDVLVTSTGARTLTQASKELIRLNGGRFND